MEVKESDKPFAVIGQGSIFDGSPLGDPGRGVPHGRRPHVLLGQREAVRRRRQRTAVHQGQFTGTFIDTFPGADTAWATLGCSSSASSFSCLRASSDLVPPAPGQVDPAGRPRARRAGLRLPCLRPDGHEPVEGTASLYTYFASTAIILVLVSHRTATRSDRWLGGRNTQPLTVTLDADGVEPSASRGASSLPPREMRGASRSSLVG